MKLSDIAKALNEKHHGNDVEIKRPGSLETNFEDQIIYVENRKSLEKAFAVHPAALIVPYDTDPGKIPFISVEKPRLAFIKILEMFNPFSIPSGIDKSAVIDGKTMIGKNTAIMAGVIIMAGASIGEKCAIYPNCVIEKDVVIGSNTILFPGVVVREKCIIGNNCIIHPGAVIGADGFNFFDNNGEKIKMPHIGIVKIGDRVEIGANSTIDRAVVDTTEIGDGAKLDNLVHVAHNVKIGKKCIIAAQAGISGSSVIGDNVMILGQAGIVDHVSIADNSIILPQSGITGDLKTADIMFGTPARPRKEHHRIYAALKYLPELFKRVRYLEEKISGLEKNKK